jgi:hypothetical protein
LALIAEFENDIRHERQTDGIKQARERGTRFGRKPLLVAETIQQVRKLRKTGKTVPEIMRQTESNRWTTAEASKSEATRHSPRHGVPTKLVNCSWFILCMSGLNARAALSLRCHSLQRVLGSGTKPRPNIDSTWTARSIQRLDRKLRPQPSAKLRISGSKLSGLIRR